MIQELIYTSVPRGLAADSQGFCTVACSSSMTPNLQRELEGLCGYRHPFLPGDARASLNPVAFFHVKRRVGGVDLHFLARVADCGIDYSQRTNKIGHLLALGDQDRISCGPAAILEQSNLFKSAWNEKPHEITQSVRPANPSVAPQKCTAWERQWGDAGWGGVVAQAIEEGRPVSLVFRPGMQMLPLIAEALALLTPEKRWNATFSTFFMRSQETAKDKIQVKCILADSEEMAFARLSQQTLFLDLRQAPSGEPQGKYVQPARTGVAEQPKPSSPSSWRDEKQKPQSPVSVVPGLAGQETDVYDIKALHVPTGSRSSQSGRLPIRLPQKKTLFPYWILAVALPIFLVGGIVAVAVFLTNKPTNYLPDLKPDEMTKKPTAEEIAKQKAEEVAQADEIARQKREAEAADKRKREADEQRRKREIALAEYDRKRAESTGKIKDIEGLLAELESIKSIQNDKALETNKQTFREFLNRLRSFETPFDEDKTDEDIRAKMSQLTAEMNDKTVNNLLIISRSLLQNFKNDEADKEKIKIIQATLNKLPTVWPDLGFQREKKQHLENSKELWEYEDQIRLTYMPYAKLEAALSKAVEEPDEEADDESDDVTETVPELKEIKTSNPIQFSQEGHEIKFYSDFKRYGQSDKELVVATIMLSEDGLLFKWGDDFDREDISDERKRELHRILLAKLKIEVEGCEPKFVTLLEPTKIDLRRREAELGGKEFTLWGTDGKGIEYIVNSQEDKAYLMLEITKLSNVPDVKTVSLVSPGIFARQGNSIGFTPNIHPVGSLNWYLELTVADPITMKLKAAMSNPTLTDSEGNADELRRKIASCNRRIKNRRNRLEKARTELPVAKQRQESFQKRGQRDTKLEKYERDVRTLPDEIKTLESDIRSYQETLDRIKNDAGERSNAMKEFSSLSVASFSIYLFKPTDAEIRSGRLDEIPNNRLLLLEVK